MAAGGRDSLGDALTAAGAEVRHAPAFRTLAAEDNPELDVYGQLLQRRIDVVTFTSAAAVRSFAALYGEEQAADLLTHTTVATVGPAATEAVRRLGVSPAIVAAVASIPALVEAIRATFSKRARLDGLSGYFRCALTSLVMSNIDTVGFLKMTFSLASALMFLRFFAS